MRQLALSAVFALLLLAACRPPSAGQAHSAMGGGICPAPTTDPVTISRAFVAGDSGFGAVEAPKGVAFDAQGNIVAPDNDRNSLLVYNGQTGAFVREVRDTTNLNFNNPEHVAVGPDGRIVVSDRSHNRIVILKPDYTFERRFGSAGTGSGQFQFTEGVAVDANGDIYVADADRDDIQRFSSTGAYISRPISGLNNPEYLYVDRAARELYVSVDTEVRRYSLANFALLGRIGSGRFTGEPEGIAVDRNGRVYIADESGARIRIFTRDNTYLHSLRVGGVSVDRPDGLAYDAGRNLLLVVNDDSDNERIAALNASLAEAITWCPCTDRDADGYFADAGCAPSGDCNDGNAAIRPNATETCNNVDDDCDSLRDDTIAPRQCGTTDVGPCSFGTQACSGGGWAPCVGAIEPAPEACANAIDDDCDGSTDEAGCCTPGAEVCDGADNDCDGAADEGGACCAATESCDGIDNNCDGRTDEGCCTGGNNLTLTPLWSVSPTLDEPHDLAVFNTTSGMRVAIADSDEDRLLFLNPATGATAGSRSTATYPYSVYPANNKLYVAARVANKIQTVSPSLGAPTDLSSGYSAPRGVAADGASLYVADASSNKVVRAALATAGTKITVATLSQPTDVLVIGARLFVGSEADHLVHVYNTTTSQQVATIGVDHLTGRPASLTADAAGTLYVADSATAAWIYKFSSTSAHLGRFKVAGLTDPRGIWADEASGKFFLLDAGSTPEKVYALNLTAIKAIGECQLQTPNCTVPSNSSQACQAAGCNGTQRRFCVGGYWGAWEACQPTVAPEACGNGADDDCDGSVDEGCVAGCTTDADGDGFKAEAACPHDQRDCNDANAAVKPGVPESCGNLLDDNCDGAINENCGPCAATDCLWCVGAACPGCDGPDCSICKGVGCPSCLNHDCSVCTGADCVGCDGPDCTTCTGADCPGCTGPDCTTCVGTDCAGCDGAGCTTCVGANCPACLPLWACTEWSVCQANQEIRSCSDTHACAAPTGKPPEMRSCGQGSPDTTGPIIQDSGGSPLFSKGSPIFSKGGGGTSFFVRKRSTLLEFQSDLYQILFEYKSLKPITADVKPGKPTKLPAGIVYQYYEVATFQATVESATLYFRVPTTWLSRHGADASQVVLQRFEGGWVGLPTQQLLPSTPVVFAHATPCRGLLCWLGRAIFAAFTPPQYAQYSAVAPAAGLFAVTALVSQPITEEPAPLPYEPPDEEFPTTPRPPPATATPSTAATPPGPQETQRSFILVGLLALVVILVLAGVLFALVRSRHARGPLGGVPNDRLLELTQWISASRTAGHTDPQIREHLREAGWIDDVLDIYLKR